MVDTYQAILTYKFDIAADVSFLLDIQTVEDNFEKSVARHEFPYRDGADLEDMGQKAHVIKVRCYWMNETYAAHKTLINYLATVDNDLWELTHPEYGIIKGRIESVIVRHDDREKTAEVDLTFVEQMRGQIDPKYETSVDQDEEDAFEAGEDDLEAYVAADMEDAMGAEARGILDTVIDTGAELLGQFTGLTRQGQAYIRAVDGYVKMLNGVLNTIANPANSFNTIANPANSLVAMINYVTNLPGYVIGSLARCVERYGMAYNSLVSSPERFLQSFTTGTNELVAASTRFDYVAPGTRRRVILPSRSVSVAVNTNGLTAVSGTFSTYTRIAVAKRCALEMGYILKIDKSKALAQKQARTVKAFTPEGRLIKSPATLDQPLTVNEIEQSLAIVRTQIQEALSVSRNMQSLKTMAQTLTDHVIEVKKRRPKIVAVSVDNTLPLHLVCLRYGLPYSYAEQLMGINNIRNPNFVRGEVNVYVR